MFNLLVCIISSVRSSSHNHAQLHARPLFEFSLSPMLQQVSQVKTAGCSKTLQNQQCNSQQLVKRLSQSTQLAQLMQKMQQVPYDQKYPYLKTSSFFDTLVK